MLEPGDPFLHAGGFELTGSTIALDVATGEIRWHLPRGPAELDSVSAPGNAPILRLAGGDTVVAHAGGDGRFYVADATDGEMRSVTPYADDGDPARSSHWSDTPGCPNVRGSPAFASAFSPLTGLVYASGADACVPTVTGTRTASNSGWLGAYYAGAGNALGLLTALDPGTGEVAARRLFDFPLHAGVLATAGGLVFTTTAEGTLHALDDETLETLWSQTFATLSPIPPFTFAVDGEQFVGIVVGGNALGPELSFRPPAMRMTEAIFVLVVLGLDR
jgi:alcohol dehydrogenase (cytochrome c)